MAFRVDPDDLDDFATFLDDVMETHLVSMTGTNTWMLGSGQAFKGALQPGEGPYEEGLYQFETYLRAMRETIRDARDGLRGTATFYRQADTGARVEFEKSHAADLQPPV